ncbi:MAG: PaaI family thioesterase [Rhodospirillaceae bacterium]|nr:PaaI family thioesterase [Rhodospirillaceae bacterium]
MGAEAPAGNGAADKPPAGYGNVPRETLATTQGLDLLQGMIDGRFPAPPIAETLDFGMSEVAAGRCVFVGRPGRKHYNPSGSVHGGYAATLLDSAMGCAVHTLVPQGRGFTTLEIKINYVRPIFDSTGEVRCEAGIVNMGKSVATAEGRILDDKGRLLAHGTTTCLIFDL